MKTAIETLIDRAIQARKISQHGMCNYNDVIRELSEALNTEKDKIKEAYEYGRLDGVGIGTGEFEALYSNSEDYFDKRFIKNNK